MTVRQWLGLSVTLSVFVSTYFFFTRVDYYWEGPEIIYLYIEYGLLTLWLVIATEDSFFNCEGIFPMIGALIFVITIWPLILNTVVQENSVAITKFLYKPIPGLKNYHERNEIGE